MSYTNWSPSAKWQAMLDGWRSELAAAGLPVFRHLGIPRSTFGASPNFITPDLIGYIIVDDMPVEISTGMFLDRRLFGVTFPRHDDGQANDLSFVAYSIEEIATTLQARAASAENQKG